jgi:large subunit ribosomal protein L22
MIARARLRFLGTSDQKTRLVVNVIRGRGVNEALATLRFMPKAVARDLEKLLKSAVANAEQREQRLDVDQLYVSRAFVNRGPSQGRMRHRAMGRVFTILKRSCHVTLELDLRGRA